MIIHSIYFIFQKSLCSIKKTVIKMMGDISCNISEIIRTSDYKVHTSSKTLIKNSDIYELVNSDFATAECKAKNYERYICFIFQ